MFSAYFLSSTKASYVLTNMNLWWVIPECEIYLMYTACIDDTVYKCLNRKLMDIVCASCWFAMYRWI